MGHIRVENQLAWAPPRSRSADRRAGVRSVPHPPKQRSATLLAIGMPTGQRTLAGFLPGALGSVFGAGLAIPIAIALSPLFPLRVARRADPDVGLHADWPVLVAGFAIVL